MSRDTTVPHKVSIVAPPSPSPGPGPSPSPSGSELSKLAASMAAGTWAKLNAANQDPVLGVGGISGSMIHYSNKGAWNNVTKRVEYIGEDHNWTHVRYAQYDEATNAFVLASADLGWGANTQHGYDHIAVNPSNGDVYYRNIQDYTGGDLIKCSRKAAAPDAPFASLPTVSCEYAQIAIACCWWSGAFQGAGAQGCFVIFNGGDSFNRADDGQIVAFDPLSNVWFMFQLI